MFTNLKTNASKLFLAFCLTLFPIFKTALANVAVNELNKLIEKPKHAGSGKGLYNKYESKEKPFHDVLMVAFDISALSPELAQQWLMERMPRPNTGGYINTHEVELDAWWIANDERFDNSDCDSAVFVYKGDQEKARILLRQHGYGA